MRPLPFTLLWLFLAQYCLAASTLEQGYDAFEAGDVETAVAIWRNLAEQGNATAQVNLGQLYRLGKGVEADDKQAVKWYSRAIKQGSETAKYNLLLMHAEGRATRMDLDLAFMGEMKSPTDNTGRFNAQDSPANAAVPAHGAVAGPAPAATGAQAATLTASAPAPASDDWFAALPPRKYVLQVVSSSHKKVLERYAAAHLGHMAAQPQVVLTNNKGRDWYLLLLGPFDSYVSGKEMLKRLPDEVKQDKPWVRPSASVQQIAKTQALDIPPDKDWFGQLPARKHVLQIASSRYKKSLAQYAAKHLAGMRKTPQIVHTKRKGRDLYLLLLGPFDTRQQGKETLARLPPEVQKSKPWVRPATSVQQVAVAGAQ